MVLVYSSLFSVCAYLFSQRDKYCNEGTSPTLSLLPTFTPSLSPTIISFPPFEFTSLTMITSRGCADCESAANVAPVHRPQKANSRRRDILLGLQSLHSYLPIIYGLASTSHLFTFLASHRLLSSDKLAHREIQTCVDGRCLLFDAVKKELLHIALHD